MKKFFLFVFILLVLGGLGYCAFKIVKYNPKGQFLVVADKKEDRILFSSSRQWNIVPYAIIPGRTELYTIVTSGTLDVECKLTIPELASLNDSLYDITFQMAVEYGIDVDTFAPTKNFLSNPDGIINAALSSKAQAEFVSLISAYLREGYNPEIITAEWDIIKNSLVKRLGQDAKKMGVHIISVGETDLLKLPPLEVYEYGKIFRDDLLELKKKHNLEAENLRHALDLKSIETDDYYKHLEKISALIKDNPDLLKYMYIEKLSPNVQVVVPVNEDGYAFGLDNSDAVSKNATNNGKVDQENTDIDNLK